MDDVDARRREEIVRILGRVPSGELAAAGPALRAVAAAGRETPA
ncbi:hypothetical protein [Pseudonocardia sp. KRD291]|nr:hypothetical protein [Pseudonocardia sp. KRD291]